MINIKTCNLLSVFLITNLAQIASKEMIRNISWTWFCWKACEICRFGLTIAWGTSRWLDHSWIPWPIFSLCQHLVLSARFHLSDLGLGLLPQNMICLARGYRANSCNSIKEQLVTWRKCVNNRCWRKKVKMQSLTFAPKQWNCTIRQPPDGTSFWKWKRSDKHVLSPDAKKLYYLLWNFRKLRHAREKAEGHYVVC